MRVLVVGSGGREHALAWALGRSPRVREVWCAPGNAGTPGNRPVAADDLDGLVRLAVDGDVDLVVVGPEVPLSLGLVDRLEAAGVRVFGPTAAAARLEGSKAHCKAFCARWGIPTAQSVTVTSLADGLAALDRFPAPPVVKASGLAAGKGVIVAESRAEAAAALTDILADRRFGSAGEEVVLEERLVGVERSILAVCSGTDLALLVPAQDHKRLGDGDTGPNTGGMGAFAPAPLPAGLEDEIVERFLRPTVAGLQAEGTPYRGVLYAGLMLTADGPRLLEYNCRLGDPETQVILPLLDSDLVDVIDAALDGTLADVKLAWRDGAAATVVLAAPGYPERAVMGLPITGLAEAEASGALVFHAGTAPSGSSSHSGPSGPVTAGGRVLDVTGFGATVAEAVAAAYRAVGHVHFDGMQVRRDIGAGQ
jgi:phosphoribosylamine--glycine ligase